MYLWIDTTGIISWGGLLIIFILVFAETGLLLGLAIPGGETLVFTSGLLVSTGTLEVSIYLLLPLLIAAAMLGDISGYYIGSNFSEKLHKKEDTWYYKKKYLKMAEDYVHSHSQAALVGGKFLPVIRPFIPVVAGMSPITFGRFIPITLIASTVYVSSFVLLGYFLGNRFPIIQDYIGWILPISITIAVIIVIVQAKKYDRKKNQT